MVSVLDVIKEKSLFKDSSVLKIGYEPKTTSEVKHRDDVITKYGEYFREINNKETPSNLFIFGKPGTGKTMVTTLVLNEIKTLDPSYKIDHIYVYCDTAVTDLKLLKAIADGLEQACKIRHPKTSNDTDQYYKLVHSLINKHSGTVFITFDEIDRMKSFEVINRLSRIKNANVCNTNVCLIGISNDPSFTKIMDPKLKSVIAQNEIVFEPYDADELNDILTDRANLAYEPGTLEEEVIPMCAALAAQEHGDARRAINLLRMAGTIAESRKSKTVSAEDVYRAREDVERDRIEEIMSSLPLQSKILLATILKLKYENGIKITKSTIVYEWYKKLCGAIDVGPLSSRRIQDILAEHEMMGFVETSTYSTGRHGKVKDVVCTTDEMFSKILFKDARLESLQYLKIPTNPKPMAGQQSFGCS